MDLGQEGLSARKWLRTWSEFCEERGEMRVRALSRAVTHQHGRLQPFCNAGGPKSPFFRRRCAVHAAGARLAVSCGQMEPTAQTVSCVYPRPERLSPAVRLQLTWAVSWPCIALDLAYRLVESQSTLPKQEIQFIDVVFGILAFFLFSTWVVRRAVQLDYNGFHVVVLRAGGAEVGRTLTYRESLAVAWLISWRAGLIMAIPAVIAGVLLQRPDIDDGLFGWLWTSAFQLLMFHAWLMEAMLRKAYLGFDLRIAADQ